MKPISLFLFTLLVSMLTVQFSLQNIPKSEINSLVIAPPKIMAKLNFGFSHIIADMLWIRWLQSIELCTQSGGVNKEVFTVTKNTLEPTKNVGKCEMGWTYQMLDRITDLDPDFDIAYRFGILSLSVFAKDRQGASLLIEKAMKRYPTNWVLAYRGAYHYMFEDLNPVRAADLLVIAANNGAPIWVASLAAKMHMEQSKDEFALKYLLEVREQFSDNKFVERIDERIAEIKKRLSAVKK